MSRKDILESGAKIKQSYEAEPDTNAFTDDEKEKLSNISILNNLMVACSDMSTQLTTGANKAYLPVPYGFEVLEVKGNLINPASGSTLLTVDINKNGVSMLSTKMTFDSGEKSTLTATNPPVILDGTLVTDDQVTIDIDNVGNVTAGTGLIITLIGYQT